MKIKKFITTAIIISITLTVTGCTNKTFGNSKDATTSTTESADDLNTRFNDLSEQENELISDHKDVWDKVFNLMNNDNIKSYQNMEYADLLSSTIESNKEKFTTDELKILTTDLENIHKFENEMAEIQNKLEKLDSSHHNSSDILNDIFPEFIGKDFNGNDVDNSLFANNTVTVINFWFNGCKPCIAELPKLNEVNETLKAMGGELIGINTETLDGNKSSIEEAKELLSKQGATYRNIYFDSDTEAGKLASNIMAFPTTILVDSNGKIIGETLLGGIDNQENYDKLMEQVQSVISTNSTTRE